MLYEKLLFTMISAVLVFSVSCRSRQRSSKENAGSMKVVIVLKNLEDVETSKLVSLHFEANCNSPDWTRGEASEKDGREITFLVKKVKLGDVCDVRVMNPTPPDGLVFLKGQNIMYEADGGVVIGARADGQLGGEVIMSRVYKLAAGFSVLKVPVHFKDAMPSDVNTFYAELKCNPEFEGVARGLVDVDRSKNTGVFNFDAGLKVGVAYKCSKVQVSRGQDKKVFYGSADLSIQQTSSNQEIKTALVELELVEITNTDGVVIVTTPGDACKMNEIFDIDTRKCVPRS